MTTTDHILRLLYRLTRVRRLSDLISERAVARRWAELRARHLAAGGCVLICDGGRHEILTAREAAQ